jgi:hypothetical protein
MEALLCRDATIAKGWPWLASGTDALANPNTDLRRLVRWSYNSPRLMHTTASCWVDAQDNFTQQFIYINIHCHASSIAYQLIYSQDFI